MEDWRTDPAIPSPDPSPYPLAGTVLSAFGHLVRSRTLSERARVRVAQDGELTTGLGAASERRVCDTRRYTGRAALSRRLCSAPGVPMEEEEVCLMRTLALLVSFSLVACSSTVR